MDFGTTDRIMHRICENRPNGDSQGCVNIPPFLLMRWKDEHSDFKSRSRDVVVFAKRRETKGKGVSFIES